jgi:hypothetical protein
MDGKLQLYPPGQQINRINVLVREELEAIEQNSTSNAIWLVLWYIENMRLDGRRPYFHGSQSAVCQP